MKETFFSEECNIKDDIQVFSVENEEGLITPKSIELAFKKADFEITATKNTNQVFMDNFNESDFTVYNMMTFYQKDLLLALAKDYEEVGVLSPMSMSIYTLKGTNKISIATLSIEGMAKILNIPKDDERLMALNNLIIYALKLALEDGVFEERGYACLEKEGDLISKFSMPVEEESWKDKMTVLDLKLNEKVTENGLIIVTQKDLHEDFTEALYDGYDFYRVYSLCKVNILFDIAKSRPEAGAFAPCSCYVYKKRGENDVHIGFPSVYNWLSSLSITKAKDVKLLSEIQEGMQGILLELVRTVEVRNELNLS
ncbi:MAG: Unknown protein [uncultured Sulfurovum sp.]|uniref:DUF302 domain-containing protein n=1 Tax=uncultured Sulfurovum sp. TaxID=269237 RepID=A0A6S6T956_9BACT|nr:MAG: Unknown protein [uncultured Sulfurovum sp.]